MNSKRKHTFKIVLAALLLLNLVVSTRAIILLRSESKPANARTSSSQFFIHYLYLDEEQAEKFNELNNASSQITGAVGAQMGKLQQQFIAEISAQEVDSVKLESIYEDILTTHSQITENNRKFYINLYDICDSLQSVRLMRLFDSTTPKFIDILQEKSKGNTTHNNVE